MTNAFCQRSNSPSQNPPRSWLRLFALAACFAGCASAGDAPKDSGTSSDAGARDQGGGGADTGAPGSDVPSDANSDSGASDQGGGDRSGDGVVAPATAEALCLSAFDGLFRRYADCNGYSYDVLATLLDPEAGCATVAKAVAAGRIKYDLTASASCLDALTAVSCAQLTSAPAMTFGGCEKALAGAVPIGGTCYAQALFGECQAGAFCGGGAGGAGCPGICKATIKIGQACTSFDECETGATCNRTSGKCVADVASGSACRGPSLGECANGLACLGGTEAVAGVCGARKVSGPCDEDGECAPMYRCAGLAPGVKGTCVPLKKLGDSCTPGAGDCAFALGTCDGSKCVAYPSNGQACGTVPDEIPLCLHGYCDPKGTCRPTKLIGGACTPMSDECGPSANCDATAKACVALCAVP